MTHIASSPIITGKTHKALCGKRVSIDMLVDKYGDVDCLACRKVLEDRLHNFQHLHRQGLLDSRVMDAFREYHDI